MNKLTNRLSNSFIRVRLSEKVLFARHLSIMLKAGMTAVESLKLVRRQIGSKGFATILDKVISGVENGQFLSVALGEFKPAFGELFISIIKLGETSGTLSENLYYLAGEMKKDQQLRSKVKAALIYPIIILIFTVLVIIMLVFFVLPKLIAVFSTSTRALPITTRILVGTVSFISNYYYLIILAAIGLVILFKFLMRMPDVKYAFDRFLLMLPVIGNVYKNYDMAIAMRTLGLLLKSGMKIVEAVITTSEVLSNSVYKRAFLEAAEEVKKGEPMYKYLEKQGAIFPPTISHMIEVGEKTGNLDSNLMYLAEFYEEEVDETVKNLSSVLEPALLLVMGGIVGFVAVSIISQIYELSQGVK